MSPTTFRRSRFFPTYHLLHILFWSYLEFLSLKKINLPQPPHLYGKSLRWFLFLYCLDPYSRKFKFSHPLSRTPLQPNLVHPPYPPKGSDQKCPPKSHQCYTNAPPMLSGCFMKFCKKSKFCIKMYKVVGVWKWYGNGYGAVRVLGGQ